MSRMLRFVFLFAAFVSGCVTTPPGADFPKSPSSALANPEQTKLGRAFAAAEREHPGLSGFRLLATGIDGFKARIEMAAAAQRTLDVQYFLIENDSTGQLIIESLLQAADRGVRVRVLLDDAAATGRDAQIGALAAHPNIELRVFNPFLIRGEVPLLRTAEFTLTAVRLDYRMHNKLFVADNAIAVMGGRNIGDEYFEASHTIDFSDYDLFIAGPIVKQLSTSFDVYWNSALAIPFEALGLVKPSAAALDEYRKRVTENHARMKDSDYLRKSASDVPLAAVLARRTPLIWAQAEAIYDSPDKAKVVAGESGGRQLRQRLEEAAQNVRSELIIVSPYLVPGESGMSLLKSLRARNRRVRILTNSLASTDASIVNAGYSRYRIPMLEDGIELFEVRPVLGQPAMRGGSSLKSASSGQFALHAKIFVFDRSRVFIGSMNFDERSRRLNTELGLIVDSPVIAQQVATRFDAVTQPANSYVLSLSPEDGSGRRALVWRTEEDGKSVEYTQEPAGTFWRRLKVNLLSLLHLDSEL